MQYTSFALLSLAAFSQASAISGDLPTVQNHVRDSPNCPAVWQSIAIDLRKDFQGCNDNAASAVRFAFHDAAGYSVKNPVSAPASGGADGSLLLNANEVNRQASAPLPRFRAYLQNKYNNYKDQGVSAADFIQFAGSIGIRSCPGGPVVPTVVGRTDTSTAAPDGNLPAAFGRNASAAVLLQLWADKGINARELAALMGAHTISRAVAQFPNVFPGAPQDTTNRVWDTTYYTQTSAKNAPLGVGRFASDVNLAGDAPSGCQQAFKDFGGDASVWAQAFAPAMAKLSLLGIPADVSAGFVDCTALL